MGGRDTKFYPRFPGQLFCVKVTLKSVWLLFFYQKKSLFRQLQAAYTQKREGDFIIQSTPGARTGYSPRVAPPALSGLDWTGPDRTLSASLKSPYLYCARDACSHRFLRYCPALGGRSRNVVDEEQVRCLRTIKG